MATKQQVNTEKELVCGIVMPISEIDGCTSDHWQDVKSIIIEAATDAGFIAKLVSDSNDVGIIQKNIVQNLSSNDIIVCDVSCLNPNVMFELGMRLAMNKPAVVLKDDITKYSFDTSPIEHLSYPRDLRFTTITQFKIALKDKIKATYEYWKKDGGESGFMKAFGPFEVVQFEEKPISGQDYIIKALAEMSAEINRLSAASKAARIVRTSDNRFQNEISPEGLKLIKDEVLKYVKAYKAYDMTDDDKKTFITKASRILSVTISHGNTEFGLVFKDRIQTIVRGELEHLLFD